MDRLETVSSEIYTKIINVSDQKKIEIIIAACEFAIKESKINHPLINKVMEYIRNDRRISQVEKSSIEKLVANLDNEYFDLLESSEEGKSSTDEYIEAFSKARAASALLCAFNEDILTAAKEVVYEASSVVEDKNELFYIISNAI